MQINKVNYALVVYLALIEGLSLLVLDLTQQYPVRAIEGLFVGFIPAFIVLSLYRLISNELPIKINGREITELPLLYPSILNAIFIELLFLIQILLPNLTGILGSAVFGFLSVFISSFVLVFAYNIFGVSLGFELNSKMEKLIHIDLITPFYAGIFEFFILPLMAVFYVLKLPVFINGLIAGFVGSLIGLWIINKILEKKPLELLL